MPATEEAKLGKKPQENKAAKKPQDHQFGKKSLHTVKVPSGAKIKVIRPGVQGLIASGLLESMDVLTGIVQSETIPKAEGKDANAVTNKVMADPELLKQMLGLTDKIALHCVRSPRLHPAPTAEDLEKYNEKHPDAPLSDPEDLRDDDLAYVDYVDEMDKMFIFNYVIGGSKDLTTFREASEGAMGSVQPVQTDGDQTK